MARGANAYLTHTFPLSRAQRDSLSVFGLHRRTGVAGASYPWDSRSGTDYNRVKVRATAKALRALAAELELRLPSLHKLESAIAYAREDAQHRRGKQVYPQLRALLDQLGRDGEAALGSGFSSEHLIERAERSSRQLVALRRDNLVLSRFHGFDECHCYLDSSAAKAKFAKLREAVDAAAEERRIDQVVSLAFVPQTRSRLADLAA